MKEEEYGKLPADQKKSVDRCLRAVPRSLEDIMVIVTEPPVAHVSGKIEILTTVTFHGFTNGEVKKINEWWG